MNPPPIIKEIAYKNNLPFITSANTWLDKITEANVSMTIEPKKYLDQYFQLISAFYKKHYAHINKKRNIKGRLKTIRGALFNPNFRKNWKEEENMHNVDKNILKIIDAIDDILMEMTLDLSTAGITPDMIDKNRDNNNK